MLLNIEKKTKIVGTIGPASDNKDMVLKLYKAGLNVMRINFSHGTYPQQLEKIKIARDLEKEGIYIPVALDTKGPEIRTGYMKDGRFDVPAGTKMRISMKERLGDIDGFSTSYPGLYDDVSVNDHILIDDGNLDFLVVEKDAKNKELVVVAQNNHFLKDQKGMNCPSSRLSMPFISEKDENDLKFGVEQNVDAIFASFVRRPEDVQDLRKTLAKYGGGDIPIFAKIENPEAVEKIDAIIAEADGVMVARGDLGVEIPPEEVPVVQKHMVEQCRKMGKPVIVATQMLDSMMTHPRPTRAEVSDVSLAISQSADCVMLSGESASGAYPVEAVKMQARIAKTMEQFLDYERLAEQSYDTSEKTNNDAISNAVANTALLIGAKLIVNFTETGNSTIRISKARPCCPIISVTNRRKTAMMGAFEWGVYSKLLPTETMPDFIEEMEVIALKIARDLGLQPGDPIVMSCGTPTGAGKTNTMRILMVNAIRELE